MRSSSALAVALVCAATAVPAGAVRSCELNGQHVNPNNGNTTAGKTGVMRCRDGNGGSVVREQELAGRQVHGRGGLFQGRAAREGAPAAFESPLPLSWNFGWPFTYKCCSDERGRVTRERDLDGSGNVVRDDEVFEDGSRKAYGR